LFDVEGSAPKLDEIDGENRSGEDIHWLSCKKHPILSSEVVYKCERTQVCMPKKTKNKTIKFIIQIRPLITAFPK